MLAAAFVAAAALLGILAAGGLLAADRDDLRARAAAERARRQELRLERARRETDPTRPVIAAGDTPAERPARQPRRPASRRLPHAAAPSARA
jgi:hypothetical protein